MMNEERDYVNNGCNDSENYSDGNNNLEQFRTQR